MSNGVNGYSRDGRLLACQNRNHSLILLDADTGQEIVTLETYGAGRLMDFDFSPDGSRLAISCFDDLQILNIADLREELTSLGLDW